MSTAIGQGGLVMFGPQWKKGAAVQAGNWHAHRVLDADMGVNDDTRTFPPEVGGRPVPAGAYKGSVTVGGGMTLAPRLENSTGWLLYSLMGKLNGSTKALATEGVASKLPLTVGTHSYTSGDMVAGGVLPAGVGKLSVTVHKGDATPWAGVITLTGPSAATETFDFGAGPTGGQRAVGLDTDPAAGTTGYETIVGTVTFTGVTTIDTPAYANQATDPVYISVGYEDPVAVAHEFVMDPADPTMVRWLGIRKSIPATDDGVAIGETYQDCKLVNAAMTFPNDGLITMRADALGRNFFLEESPAWALSPTFEDYGSAPISTVIGGYINIPAFSSDPLPVINATFAWQNNPLDQRQERTYGTPFLEDITITDRRLVCQLAVKYKNPDLYRAILGNSKLATTWSPKPFTSRLDISAVSPTLVAGGLVPYGLRVQAQSVMLGMRTGIVLSGNDAVILRLTGTVLDTTGTYASFTLTNGQAGYTWPTA